MEQKKNEVGILLIQDGVYTKLSKDLKAYACLEDVKARDLPVDYELVDYRGIVKLFFEYDKVIVW